MSEVMTKTFAEQIADKNKKRKTLISIISLSFVLILSLIVILLAIIKVDLRPSVITDPSSIYFNSQSTIQYDKNDQEYHEFLKEYNNAFQISYLTAMFSGRLGGYEIQENQLKSLPNNVTEGDYVTFLYKNEEDYLTLTKSNGRVYYSNINSNYVIKFFEVTFALSEDNKIKDTTMYLKYNYPDSTTNYYIEVNVKANTFKLNKIYENIN